MNMTGRNDNTNNSNNNNNNNSRNGCGENDYDEMVIEEETETIENTIKIQDNIEKEKKEIKNSKKNESIEKLRIKLFQFNMNLNRTCGVVGGRSVTMPEGNVSW